MKEPLDRTCFMHGQVETCVDTKPKKYGFSSSGGIQGIHPSTFLHDSVSNHLRRYDWIPDGHSFLNQIFKAFRVTKPAPLPDRPRSCPWGRSVLRVKLGDRADPRPPSSAMGCQFFPPGPQKRTFKTKQELLSYECGFIWCFLVAFWDCFCGTGYIYILYIVP